MIEQEQPPIEENILSSFDRERLLESGEILIGKLLKNYPDKLPDAIVLPETSAYPLKHLLGPVFNKICEERGVPMPVFYGFASHRGSVRGVEKLEEIVKEKKAIVDQQKNQLLSGEYKDEEEWMNIRKQMEYNIDDLEDGLVAAVEKLDYEKRSIEANKIRAEEIILDLDTRGIDSPEVIIFEEYVGGGGTLKQMRRAFQSNLPCYTLLMGSVTLEFNPDLEPIEYGKLFEQKDRDQVGWGVQSGFQYRTNPDKLSYIGSKKELGNPHSIMISDANPAKMFQFRKELSDIGKEIAKKV